MFSYSYSSLNLQKKFASQIKCNLAPLVRKMNMQKGWGALLCCTWHTEGHGVMVNKKKNTGGEFLNYTIITHRDRREDAREGFVTVPLTAKESAAGGGGVLCVRFKHHLARNSRIELGWGGGEREGGLRAEFLGIIYTPKI